MNDSREQGFNLIELMVAITVLGVLLGVGVPSFTGIVRSNRATSQTNDLITALNFARSEALKRGHRVSVCPGVSSACSGATDWNAGILVFTDDSGTSGDLDVSDVVLQSWPAYQNMMVASGPTSIMFTPVGAQAATVDLVVSGCTGQQAREVKVELTGRIGHTKKACP
jgi:type IV fimbrial biogenesis protein FimT